jgi:5-methylcytosine-specific restriction endonuclease McrA
MCQNIIRRINMNYVYGKLLKHPLWFKKRGEVLRRDAGRCRNCGSTSGLNVHHRQYHFCKRTGKAKLPWKYELRYLITLCEKCHNNGHSKFKIPTFTI